MFAQSSETTYIWREYNWNYLILTVSFLNVCRKQDTSLEKKIRPFSYDHTVVLILSVCLPVAYSQAYFWPPQPSCAPYRPLNPEWTLYGPWIYHTELKSTHSRIGARKLDTRLRRRSSNDSKYDSVSNHMCFPKPHLFLFHYFCVFWISFVESDLLRVLNGKIVAPEPECSWTSVWQVEGNEDDGKLRNSRNPCRIIDTNNDQKQELTR